MLKITKYFGEYLSEYSPYFSVFQCVDMRLRRYKSIYLASLVAPVIATIGADKNKITNDNSK